MNHQIFRCAFATPVLPVLCALTMACSPGLKGRAYERAAGGAIGQPISGVALSFIREGGTTSVSATTSEAGSYSITLPAGRYYVLARHEEYEDYSTAPGFAVVGGTTRRTMNVFLREPVMTTILIVRHGEKLDPDSDVPEEPLSPTGAVRAERLRENLLRAGITAVYSTDTERTRETVRPTAGLFALPTEIYSSPTSLGATIRARHNGDVVLVAAHSNTVASVANALGATLPTATIGDYDNLYVVSASADGANVINLQYGPESTPDLSKNQVGATTFLLVGDAPSGSPLSQELLHAARKAGVTAIYATGANGLVEPLAAALAITPTTYASADIPTLVPDILAGQPAGVVMIAGTNDDLRAVVTALSAHPTPVIYPSDTNHLIVVTRFPTGAVRAIPIRF